MRKTNTVTIKSAKVKERLRGLATRVHFLSWESTDGDGHDEHQGCEIDINAVGGTEEEGSRGMH